MTYITNTARYYTFSSVGLVRATGLMIVVCLTIATSNVKSYNMLQHINVGRQVVHV